MPDFSKMRAQMERGAGFIAALDQSGGSTPKALALYGVEAGDYGSDDEMFAEFPVGDAGRGAVSQDRQGA